MLSLQIYFNKKPLTPVGGFVILHIDEVKSLLTVTEGSRFETNHIIKPSVKKVLKVIYRHPVYQCVHIMNSNAFIFVYNESDDKCVGIFRKPNFECMSEAAVATPIVEEYPDYVQRNMRYVQSRLDYAYDFNSDAVEALADILCKNQKDRQMTKYLTDPTPPTIRISVEVPFENHFMAVEALAKLGLEVKTEAV